MERLVLTMTPSSGDSQHKECCRCENTHREGTAPVVRDVCEQSSKGDLEDQRAG